MTQTQRREDPERMVNAYNDGWSDARHKRGHDPRGYRGQDRDYYERGYEDGGRFVPPKGGTP